MTVFRSFVIFAGMRTGSNLLEATLNAHDVACFGEAYNPYFIGWPDQQTLYDMTLADREADPQALWRHMVSARKVKGFRYFHDHDPRMFGPLMDDPTCAKIVLTRNPVDSWVSTRLAYATNQWKLNETETPIPAQVEFDAASFRENLDQMQAFLDRIQQALQVRGQTAFWLNYDDLRDADVMTGLLHWLGRTDLDRVEPAQDQVPQNPRPMAEKVANFGAMQAELVAADPFQLHRIPGFEPRRGPAVPSFLTAEAGRGLLFMPVRGGPSGPVDGWLSALGEVKRDLTQNALRQWKRAHPGHRAFTVLRHPLPRAWDAFHAMLAARNPELRATLRQVHRVDLPPDEELHALTDQEKLPLFAAFLDFLRRNLNGQTGLATHPGWASQSEVLAGFARFGAPDLVAREDRMAEDLGFLARAAGIERDGPAPEPLPAVLDDPALRKAAKAAYLRDYVAFGFPERP
ncbi:hypothetical protein [Paracoccus sp. (in: a-proteobacteria)]|uniref:hypothetical protein n=1 Tax=Paracoccus sp. TaxID=267 RepID=UPI0026E07F17|nr:hypothetical protein [Paracoccus sp. (in: a-proteobacteria)]MDO5369667.1 hypothetical protein [Paracoccus sp. (in: a-proteobacteria)]